MKTLSVFFNKKNIKTVTAFLFVTTFLVVTCISLAQEKKESELTEISVILNNPQQYAGNSVKIKGAVTQLIAQKNQTQYYILKSDFGNSIRVKMLKDSKPPETLSKLVVQGVVYYDGNIKRFALSETNREKYIEENDSKNNAPSSKNDIINTKSTDNGESVSMKHIIGSSLAAVILLIVIYSIIRKKSKKDISSNYTPDLSPSFTEDLSTAPTIQMDATAFSTDDDFKTIKIALDPLKTLKILPGKLEIVNGDDKGKFFSISGYHTPEGAVVTIGREEVGGERSYAHIQLKQKTVSRKQAELIYRMDKLFIRNLSETNYTCLDGEELKVGVDVEVKPESIIKTGEVEFMYIL